MIKMQLIDSPSYDPALNLALEEVLLRNFSDDFLLLYVNRPSLITGKHQNVFREINLRNAYIENVDVLRRITGGGTVYHDEGNLNFSFILNGEEGKMVDFGRYIKPVRLYLESLGVPVEENQRHDLLIRGKKISGNAEHVFKRRVLHHGTLLYRSNLDRLKTLLSPPGGRFRDKAVASVRSPVTNIAPFVSDSRGISEFRSGLLKFAGTYLKAGAMKKVPMQEAAKLADQKYRRKEWIFGYNPDFVFTNSGFVGGNPCSLEVRVEKGKISGLRMDGKEIADLSYLCEKVRGVWFLEDEVRETVRKWCLPDHDSLCVQWMKLLFP